jgi:molecular chaperone HtpG
MLSDEKFYERAKDFCLYENIENKHFTLEEYKTKTEVLQKDKNNKLILLYTTDKEAQDSYIQIATKKSYDVLSFDNIIDQHFVQHLESKHSDIKFNRVDADTIDKLIEKDESALSVLSSEEEESLKKYFEETIQQEGVTIELKALSPEDMPITITKNEFMRRMHEMSKMGGGMYSFMGSMPESMNLVVNTNHALASRILKEENKKALINQLFDLALLQQGLLKGSKLTAFIERSVEVL